MGDYIFLSLYLIYAISLFLPTVKVQKPAIIGSIHKSNYIFLL